MHINVGQTKCDIKGALIVYGSLGITVDNYIIYVHIYFVGVGDGGDGSIYTMILWQGRANVLNTSMSKSVNNLQMQHL